MLYELLLGSPLVFAVVASILVMAITVHEFAHAWLADKLGDPTPRYQERLTLNPLAHLDPVGTLALLFLGFGWGKPVQFDPYNLKEPVRDAALIALAGPASNIIIAVLFFIINQFVGDTSWLKIVCGLAIQYNVFLAVFNLVPVTPLDGSKILMALLPKKTMYDYELIMNRYGIAILLFLIIPWSGQSLISRIVFPVSNFILSFLL